MFDYSKISKKDKIELLFEFAIERIRGFEGFLEEKFEHKVEEAKCRMDHEKMKERTDI